MAGAKTASKNQRAGVGNSKAHQSQADIRLLIPCGNGRNAYFRDPVTAQNPNLRTDSVQFVDAARAVVAAGFGEKLRGELGQLAAAHPGHGWDATLSRLEDEGVFAA